MREKRNKIGAEAYNHVSDDAPPNFLVWALNDIEEKKSQQEQRARAGNQIR
ncbi:MAG: hypothetical protein PHT51_01110 [Patescibacteria group bacterium]|nr:hypothetical protein [Patescibacteria group bacterium]MDD4611174.1 hypothetical protein [Patescibacteria group bacterium]